MTWFNSIHAGDLSKRSGKAPTIDNRLDSLAENREHDPHDVLGRSEPQNEWAVLWRAVIIQALKDATRNLGLQKAANASRALFTSIEARRWLLGTGGRDELDDFIDVCERAGVDSMAVRRQAGDIINGRVEFNRRVDPVESAKRRRLTIEGE